MVLSRCHLDVQVGHPGIATVDTGVALGENRLPYLQILSPVQSGRRIVTEARREQWYHQQLLR